LIFAAQLKSASGAEHM